MDDLLLEALGALLFGLKAGLPLLCRALRLLWGAPGIGRLGGSALSCVAGCPGGFAPEGLRRAWQTLALGALLCLGHALAEAQLAALDFPHLRRSLAALALPQVDPALAAAVLGLAACLLFGLSLRRASSSGYTWGVVPALGRACRVRHLDMHRDR